MPFLPVEMRELLQKATFESQQNPVKTTSKISHLFSYLAIMTFGCVHVFSPVGRLEEECTCKRTEVIRCEVNVSGELLVILACFFKVS